MICSIKTSMARENLSGLLDVSGTIINTEVLSKYNLSLKNTMQIYGNFFKKIEYLDTSSLSQSEIDRQFISTILGYIETLC